MFAGDGEGEHFGVIGSGSFAAPNLDIGSTLVGMGAATVINKFGLRPDSVGTSNVVDSCPGVSVSLGSIAEVYVESNAFCVSSFLNLVVSVVDISDEV